MSSAVVLAVLGSLNLGITPAAANSVTYSPGDLDLASTAGNVALAQVTLTAGGNISVSAPQGYVSVAQGSILNAGKGVTISAGASNSSVSNSTITAADGVSISTVGSGSISGSSITANNGTVALIDAGTPGQSFAISNSTITSAGDSISGMEAVSVTVQGGCNGNLSVVSAIESIPLGSNLTMSYALGQVAGCITSTLSIENGSALAPAVIASGPGGLNAVDLGTQQGAIQTVAGATASIALLFAPTVPLAQITSPGSGNVYNLGQIVPTAFSCQGTCEDSNGATGTAGDLNTAAAGSYTYSVTATLDGESDTATIGYSVLRGTPAITWANPSAVTYGTALSATQLNATASEPGTFAYSPPIGTVLAAGSQTLSVQFTPQDTADYTGAQGSVSLTVSPGSLVVTASSASIVYGKPIPAVNPSYVGFISGDTANSLTSAPTCQSAATSTSPAGTYATTCSGATDPNYTISYQAGTLAIQQSATSITLAPINVVPSLLSFSLTFSATLTSVTTGKGVSSASITFVWNKGADHCTATTNQSGVATCTMRGLDSLLLLLAPTYSVSYAGGTDYAGSGTQGTASIL